MSIDETTQILEEWERLKVSELSQFDIERESGVFFSSNIEELRAAAAKYRHIKASMAEIQKNLWALLNDEQLSLSSSPRCKKLTRLLQNEFGDIKHKMHQIDSAIADIEERIQESRMFNKEMQSISMESGASSCISFPELGHESYGLSFVDGKFVFKGDEQKTASGLDDFSIIREMRRTLQGKLVEAIFNATGQKVAIKMCRKELIASHKSLSGKSVLEDPIQEAQLMRNLQFPGHPNVMRIIDSFETEEEFCIVLEYAERGEFFDIISQAGRLDEEVAKQYFKQMVLGLRYIHERSICHLDLSLENILMSAEGTIVIADFGLARPMEGEPFSLVKAQRPGKAQYMAPEIYSGMSGFHGDKADCFSLGVILFILLAGFPPFDAPSISDRRFSMIMKGKASLFRLITKWKLDTAISKTAVDLLSQLLCSAEKRIGVQDILLHDWLQ